MVSEEVFHRAGNQHLCQCNQLRATGAVLHSFTFNVVILCLCSDLVETNVNNYMPINYVESQGRG